MARAACSGSDPFDRRDPPVGDRCDERGVVALVLVGVGLGELDDRAVEGVALPQVGGDGQRVPGAGMRASQGPGADLRRRARARLGAIRFGSNPPLPSLSWRR